MMLISHEDRKHYRDTIGHLGTLTQDVEKIGRGEKTISADKAKILNTLTGSSDLFTQFQALTQMRDEVAALYDDKLREAAASDLSAFGEFMTGMAPAPHHIFLANHLHRVESGECMRSMVSMPPGHAKPLCADTPVMLGDGSWKALGAIAVGDFVVTKLGRSREVLAVHRQGTKTAIRIETKSGRVVRAEPSHPFLTPSGWVEAGDLVEGDRLTLIKEYELPDASGRSPVDFSLAGYLIAMGFVRNRSYSRIYRIGKLWRTDDLAVLEDFLELARGKGFQPRVKRQAHYDGVVHTVELCDAFVAWLNEVELYDLARDELFIPDWIAKGDATRIACFVGAIVSMDATLAPVRGSRGMRQLQIVTRSKRLMGDLQRLLLRLGARSRKTRTFCRNYNYRPMTFHYLTVTDGADQAALKRSLRLIGGTRRFWELPIQVDEYEHPTFATDEIIAIEDDGTADMVCLTVDEDASFLANGLVVHNSTYCSHLFPAWYLGRHPNKRYLQAGHTQKFCEDEFSAKVRGFLEDPKFREVFPDVTTNPEKRALANWEINKPHRGRYVTRGVGQGIAGIRGECAGVDDPFPSLEAARSQLIRDKTYNWFWADFYTRLLPGAPLFIVATRWHMDDVCGRIEVKSRSGEIEHFEVINLPAICIDAESDPMGREIGEALWSNFFTKEWLMRLKSGMEPRQWEALYQGNPVPSEGRMIQESWLRSYESLPQRIADANLPPHKILRRVTISVDAANKDTQRSDFTVITVWYESMDRKHYLAEVVRKRLNFNDLITEIESVAARHSATAILVEDAGAGSQYIQLRSGKAPAPIIPCQTKNKDKEFRFDAVIPMFEAGEVWLPESAHWLGEYLQELLVFPDGKNDDQVDSTSQYLHWARFKRRRGTAKLRGAG